VSLKHVVKRFIPDHMYGRTFSLIVMLM